MMVEVVCCILPKKNLNLLYYRQIALDLLPIFELTDYATKMQ